MKKLIFIVCVLAIAACSGCIQSQQEDEGVSLLPQNRPTTSEMRQGMGIPLNY
jgi:hypothetical protein